MKIGLITKNKNMKNIDENCVMENAVTYRLVKEKTDLKQTAVLCSSDSAKFARQFYHEDIEIYESFFIMLLNRRNAIESYVKISQGGIVGTVVDVKLIVKYVVDSLASGVILVHNHPSGNLHPSKHDISLTKKIISAMTFFDCQVLDHIILTTDSYTSFADDNIL